MVAAVYNDCRDVDLEYVFSLVCKKITAFIVESSGAILTAISAIALSQLW